MDKKENWWDPSDPAKRVRTRILVFVFILIFALFLVIGRLLFVIFIQGERLQSDLIDESLSSTEIAAKRGTIYDVTGSKILATTSSVWDVIVSPRDVTIERDENGLVEKNEIDLLSIGLKQILGLDYNETYSVLSGTQSQYYKIATQIDTDTKNQISDYCSQMGLSGVSFEENFKRYYPYNTEAANVLGFVNSENSGAAGIEYYYENELGGIPGRLESYKDPAGNAMDFEEVNVIGAQDGYDFVLSIDETIQSIVETKLKEGAERYGAKEGGLAILMDVTDGSIIAMAQTNVANPNNPGDIEDAATNSKLSKQQNIVNKAKTTFKERADLVISGNMNLAGVSWDSLLYYSEDELAEIDSQLPQLQENVENARTKYFEIYNTGFSKQWRNKAVSDTYYPGSVFKMITAASALDSGSITQKTKFSCIGYFEYQDGNATKTIDCWINPGTHGIETVTEGICNSCNPFFIQVGQAMGRSTFFSYFSGFGFTELTGIDLPGETIGQYYDEAGLNVTELATLSFGQNFSITPIQMITACSTIANGGHLIKPHVVDKIIDSDGNIVYTAGRTEKRQVISKDVAQIVSDILEENATTGSGKNGYVPGYRVCGKTGTSEKVDAHNEALRTNPNAQMEYIASFCGYAPAENPKYCLLVYYDEPDRGSASGGGMAAPVFSDIMSEVLPMLGIEKNSNNVFGDTVVTAPDVTGKTIAEAREILEEAGLYSEVFDLNYDDSDVVTVQCPSARAKLPEEGTVWLYVDSKINKDKLVSVPDFINLDTSNARYLAMLSNIQIIVEGNSSSEYGLVATNQELNYGTKVMPGTVVTVTFMDSSASERN